MKTSLHLHRSAEVASPHLPEPSAVIFLSRFPTMSPLKSLPTRPLFRDSNDLPRLIRWDDYEELPQQENIAPLKSNVMVRKKETKI